MSRSLELARPFLGRVVVVEMDRPLGSRHPRHGFVYRANYGYVPGTLAPDGEPLDAYVLGVTEPLQRAEGTVIAIIHRFDDDDDKLVVVSGRRDALRRRNRSGGAVSGTLFSHLYRSLEGVFFGAGVYQGQSRACTSPDAPSGSVSVICEGLPSSSKK